MDFQRLFYINHEFENQTFDWVRLVFGSVSFDWLRWEKFTALQPDRKPGLFSDYLENEKACFIMSRKCNCPSVTVRPISSQPHKKLAC